MMMYGRAKFSGTFYEPMSTQYEHFRKHFEQQVSADYHAVLFPTTTAEPHNDSVHALAHSWRPRTMTEFNKRWNPIATAAGRNVEFDWSTTK